MSAYPTSPFNSPPTTGPDAGTAAMVARLLKQGQFTKLKFGYWRTAADFTHPVYTATASDPLYTIRSGYGNTWVNPDVEGKQIHCPSWVLPAGGSDGSLAIRQPDGTEYDLWLAQRPSNGVIRCGFGKLGRWDGDGLSPGARVGGDGSKGGITAAGFQNGLGLIKLSEIKLGHIPHALFIAIHGWTGRCWPGVLKAKVMGQDPQDAYAPMMGQGLLLNMSASEIDALKRPAWQTTILKAMAEFGMRIGDQSGSVIALQAQSEDEWIAKGQASGWATWAATAPGVQKSQQTVVNVDTGKDETRTIYQLDWTAGVPWSDRLQFLAPGNPPA